nr:hypothetical protein [uncultured Porphyromonas sp.]
MKRLLFLLLTLLHCTAWGQVYNTPDSIYVVSSGVYIPPVSGEPIYLLASPLRPVKTRGSKIRTRDWVKVDFSEDNNFMVVGSGDSLVIENFFAYYAAGFPEMKEYELYYKGAGEEITKEDFDSIKFTRMPTALREIKKYKLPRARRTLGEVDRWQHPHLLVVEHDKKAGRYYKYRIALVIYMDYNHPEAYHPGICIIH